jgi:hypothetical protein
MDGMHLIGNDLTIQTRSQNVGSIKFASAVSALSSNTLLTIPNSGIANDNSTTKLLTIDDSKTLKYVDVSSLPANNPFNQSLNTTNSPTFAGITSPTITAPSILTVTSPSTVVVNTTSFQVNCSQNVNLNCGAIGAINLNCPGNQAININSNTISYNNYKVTERTVIATRTDSTPFKLIDVINLTNTTVFFDITVLFDVTSGTSFPGGGCRKMFVRTTNQSGLGVSIVNMENLTSNSTGLDAVAVTVTAIGGTVSVNVAGLASHTINFRGVIKYYYV